MNNTRNTLRRLGDRFDSLMNCPFGAFAASFELVDVFLRDDPILSTIASKLLDEHLAEIAAVSGFVSSNTALPDFRSESAMAAFGLSLLRGYGNSLSSLRGLGGRLFGELNYPSLPTQREDDEAKLGLIRARFVEPIRRHFEDSLVKNSETLNLLRQYKHRCEWFDRKELIELFSENQRVGEARLKVSLYRYLFDNGIDIAIEPSSIDGRVDILGTQQLEEPLIAECKVLSKATKAAVLAGFRQAYRYTVKYNEPYGYVIIFNMLEGNRRRDLRLNVSGSTEPFPYEVIANRRVYIIEIDLMSYSDGEKWVSQRGRFRPLIIETSDLIGNGGHLSKPL